MLIAIERHVIFVLTLRSGTDRGLKTNDVWPAGLCQAVCVTDTTPAATGTAGRVIGANFY